MAVRGIQEPLLITESFNMVFQDLLVVSLRFVNGIDFGRPLFQIDIFALRNAVVLCAYFHGLPAFHGLLIVSIGSVTMSAWLDGRLRNAHSRH